MAEWDEQFESTVRTHLRYLRPETPLDAEARLVDLGLDSVQMISLLLILEEAFGVTIPDEALTQEMFSTPTTLWRVIAELREKTAGNPM